MTKVLLIGLGGALGAMSRYLLGGWVQRVTGSDLPLGTLAVNVIGCLFIGAIMTLVEDRQVFRPETRLFLVTGILGGFTTFSSFGYETFALLRDGESWFALGNVAANVLLGLAAVIVGRILVQFLGG